MKRMLSAISLAMLAGVAISAQDSSQELSKQTPPKTPQKVTADTPVAAVQPAQPTQLSPFNKASTFLGSSIQSVNGKPLGKVLDLVFDFERGELAYVVISLDSGNGKTRNVAVPPRALKPAAAHLILNISEPVVAAAESLQEGDWPETNIFAVGAPAATEAGTATSKTESPQN